MSNEQNEIIEDLRGIKCPMNFVYTKNSISKIKIGETITVLLDDGQPIQNVPRSIGAEGHIIVDCLNCGDFWKLKIKKGYRL
ncbi:MAG: sulfurtransferase TusA family protein [Fibrobacteres bacterium]|nr:sulfurtransferase TusA family protein [Fibrobacterota bacterium]